MTPSITTTSKTVLHVGRQRANKITMPECSIKSGLKSITECPFHVYSRHHWESARWVIACTEICVHETRAGAPIPSSSVMRVPLPPSDTKCATFIESERGNTTPKKVDQGLPRHTLRVWLDRVSRSKLGRGKVRVGNFSPLVVPMGELSITKGGAENEARISR